MRHRRPQAPPESAGVTGIIEQARVIPGYFIAGGIMDTKAAIHEPDPTGNGQVILDLVRKDFEDRAEMGLLKYKTFQLRAIEKAAHPQMRDLMIPLYLRCHKQIPELFDLGDPQ
jgi:hypothetical protein